jgi:hypothetical protein
MTTENKMQVVIYKAILMTVTQQSDKFIENLMSKVPNITHHHYTAKQKAK